MSSLKWGGRSEFKKYIGVGGDGRVGKGKVEGEEEEREKEEGRQ